MTGGLGGARAVALLVLLAAVGVAFADSSIVVLALPDLLRDFDVSIGSVAWVITSYNLVLALAGLILIRVAPRFDPVRMALAGGTLFVLASLGCAAAVDNWMLIAFRAAQGLGASLLLVGILPVVQSLVRGPARGSALWTAAGVLGASLGPALGGALTQVFDWRAIFVAQAPVGVAATLVLGRLKTEEHQPHAPAPAATRVSGSRLAAGAGLALASAALVGLLFLAVIELIDVWRLSPLRAAAIVSVIPIATLAVARLAASAGARPAAAGAVLMTGGLAGMAFVPALDLRWVIAFLTIAGIGYGLLMPSVARGALSEDGPPTSNAALTLSLRHLGLVGGLLLLTPLLAADLSRAGTSAQLRGVAIVLDSPVPASAKLHVAIDLAPVLGSPASKGLPDFSRVLRSRPAPIEALGHELDTTVASTVTRAFRRTFLAAAIFALLAALPIALMARGRKRVGRRWMRAPAVALLIVSMLLVGEFFSGALSYGTKPAILPPCADRARVTSGSSSKGQRVVLEALDVVACHAHESREQLVVGAARRGVGAYQLIARAVRLAEIVNRL